MSVGRFLKKIRKNKGYTQVYMANNILTQGSYSKLEDGQPDVKAEVFFGILKKFHMSAKEFIFISNEYNHTDEHHLLNEFFNLPYNDLLQLNLLKEKINDHLLRNNDLMLNDVSTICNALIELSLTQDIDAAREIVIPVWDRLSKHNSWYLTDIQLINVLLYLFPVEDAIEITNTVLNRLNLYIDYQEAINLQFTLRINLTFLLLQVESYQKALNILVDTINKYQKKMPYQSLALCYSRKSICLHQLGDNSSEIYLHKAKQLLDIYEDNAMLEVIENEYQMYTNKKNVYC